MFKNFKRKRINIIDSKKNIDNIERKEEQINIINKIEIEKKQSNLIRIFKLIIWITLIIFCFIYKWYHDFKSDILINKEIIIKIESWDSINDLTNKLNIDKSFFKFYLKNNNQDFKLIAWNFKISKNANIKQILSDLKTPIIENEINITELEWWNIYDIDDSLTKKWLIKKWDYIKYVTNKNKIEKLTKFFPFIKWLDTLEWYLYPDTYTVISNNFKINVFVIKQLENFENKVYNKIFKKLDNWAIKDTINLASIVEKEEKNITEKPTVAWILKKRLNSWWMIWADITVCYPHKLTANECKMVITKYINEKSDYNTRTMIWLPKTPIWNPSYETINATLHSKNTSHWFYLHDTKTWKIYYSDTNKWHTINKNRYLR